MTEEIINRAELKDKSIKGAAMSMTSQMFKFVLMFVNQIIMARLLMPEDFGLVAMVTPIMAFILLFADLGLTQATIQRQKITQQELSFLFWTNVTVATTLAVIVMLISPFIGMFYHEPRVVAIACVMGATLIFTGLTSQHSALFTRNMEYKKIIFLDMFCIITGFAAGIISALSGLEYWSLVVTHTVIYVCNMCGAWTLSKWRPSRPELPENWRSLMKFGGNLSGFNFVNYLSRNLDNVLIGRFNGEVQLGLYDRAYKLLLMPLTQIILPFSRVSLPLLSRTLSDPALYRKAYLRMLEVIMLVIYPGVLFAVIMHDNLIRTVLGDRWAEVGDIFMVLGASSFIGTINHTTGWLFISQDRTREMRNWGIISSATIVAGFVVGLPWGPMGVATGYLTVITIQAPILWWIVTRHGPLRYSDYIQTLTPYAVSLAASGAAIYGLGQFLPRGIISLALLLPTTYVLFLATFLAMPKGRAIFFELWGHGMKMFAPYLAKFRPKPVSVEDEPL